MQTVHRLLDIDGNPIASTTTGANGDYSFGNLAAGDYKVMFEDSAAEGKQFIGQTTGTADGSDVDPTNGMTNVVSVTAGNNTPDVDAGVEDIPPVPGSLSGTYFCDDNRDGVDNAGDADVAGKTVTLLNADGTPAMDIDGNPIASTTTDSNGDYSFTNLAAGDYKVMFEDSSAEDKAFIGQTEGTADGSDVDPANGMTGTVSVTAGNNTPDVDAGVASIPGSLSGTYFCDDNGDGVDNAGDADVAGKTVTLLNADGTPAMDIDGNPIASTTTGANGDYSFGNLAAGDYKVMFEDSAAEGKQFIGQTTGTADGSDVDPANGMTNVVSVTAGNNTPDVDAGVEDIPPVPGSLSGTYFCDDNRDGVDNAGDADVAGKTVTLLNADGTPAMDIDGNPIASTTTDSNGDYSFTNLAAGDYKVMFEDSAAEDKAFIGQTTGTADGSDVDPANGMTGTVSVTAGNNTPDVDAGVASIPGSLSGTYFCDDNGDGVDNAGDADVAGKTVTLLNADGTPAMDIDGNPIASTTTGANGDYSFGNLAAGDYKVMFEDSAAEGKQFIGQTTGTADGSDVDPTNGMTNVVSVTAGNNTPDVDAGVEDIPPVPGSLSGTYFCDDNQDGDDDGAADGDKDVVGKTVTLLNADGTPAIDIDGNPVAPVLTGLDGNYSFTNLAAGDYKVMFEDSSAEDKQFIAQNAGNDDTDDSDVDPANGMTGTVSVVAGEETTDVDAGVEAIPNEAPTPMDDAEDTCYFDAVSIDVTANDTDPENDALTITAINGMAITEGGSALDIGGVQVSLVSGELVFDGSTAHAGLTTGEEAIANYSYTVSDGNGNESSANVEVTFCGATDTLDKVKDIIPTTVQFQIIDENDPAPSSDEAWTMQVTDATGVLSGTFGFAYCLSVLDNALSGQFGTDINAAALINANVYVADDDCLPASIDFGGTGLNGQDASDNLDMINWIINQGFTGQDNGDGSASNYTDNEIQAAIWGLTDGLLVEGELFVSNDGNSTSSNAQEIYDAAIANGEGFEANAANGDVTTVYFDPTSDNDPNNDHEQAFIAAIDLFEDCIC